MMRTLLKIISIFNLSFYYVSAYSTGAPTAQNRGVCVSMSPFAGHSSSTAPMPSPYGVSVDKRYFAPGEEVTVTITGNANFNGILLQGRETGTDKVVGSFSGLSAKLRNAPCPNLEDSQTVTHSEKINMNTISVKWSPPADVSSLGNVSFLATVVQSRTVYWVKLESSQLSNSMRRSLISAPLQPSTSMPVISLVASLHSPASVYVGVTKFTGDFEPSVTSFPSLASVYVGVTKATEGMKPTSTNNGTMMMSSSSVSTTKKTTTTCCSGHAFISNVFFPVVCATFVIGQLL